MPAHELLSYFVLLIVAGNETTRNATSGGLLALMEHRDEMRKLRGSKIAMVLRPGLSLPQPGCEELFSNEISCVTTWTRASNAIGSLGFFSASSKRSSVTLSTRATAFLRSSSVSA